MRDGFAHAALGGVGQRISKLISSRLNVKTRSIEFSTLQRCCSQNISLSDYEEAFSAGFEGTGFALDGKTGFMAGFKRSESKPYKCEVVCYDVNLIANLEKKIPPEMRGEDGMSVTESFIDYALPLIDGEPELQYENGVVAMEIL